MIRIFSTDDVSGGIKATLNNGDDVYVGAGVVVGSTDTVGILGTGSDHEVAVFGKIITAGPAINLGADPANHGFQSVTIGASAEVRSIVNSAIQLIGHDSVLHNAGKIYAWNAGVLVSATGGAGSSVI